MDRIREAKELELKSHEKLMARLNKESEYKRIEAELEGIAKLDKVNYRNSYNKLKYGLQEIELEVELKLKEEERKQMEAKYEFNIELPGKLSASYLKLITSARCRRKGLEVEAECFRIKELGKARIEKETSEQLSFARGSKQVAFALQAYYKALILDKACACLLGAISKKFNLDPEFRMKLERPLRIKRQINNSKQKSIEFK